MYPAHAFAMTLEKIKNDHGIAYLRKIAKLFGNTAANEFKTSLKKLQMFISKDFKNLPAIIEMSGLGKVEKYTKKPFILGFKNHAVLKAGFILYGENCAVVDFYGQALSEFIKVFHETKNKYKLAKYDNSDDTYYEWVFS